MGGFKGSRLMQQHAQTVFISPNWTCNLPLSRCRVNATVLPTALGWESETDAPLCWKNEMSNWRNKKKKLVNTTITKFFLLHRNGVELLRLFWKSRQGDGPFSRIIEGNLKYHLDKGCNSWVGWSGEQVNNHHTQGQNARRILMMKACSRGSHQENSTPQQYLFLTFKEKLKWLTSRTSTPLRFLTKSPKEAWRRLTTELLVRITLYRILTTIMGNVAWQSRQKGIEKGSTQTCIIWLLFEYSRTWAQY